MRLYRVTVETEFFITAQDDDDAFRVARRHYDRALSDAEPDLMYADEVTDVARVPKVWRDSLPYGEHADLTCEQVLKATV